MKRIIERLDKIADELEDIFSMIEEEYGYEAPLIEADIRDIADELESEL